MGARADHRATLQAVSRPILSELWKSTRETVNLATLDQGNVLYIEVLESPHEFRLSSRVGSRRSLHATALGKALAAFLHETHREQILERIEFSAAHSENDHEPGAIPAGAREGSASGLCGGRRGDHALERVASAHRFWVRTERRSAAISVSGPVTRVGREQVGALGGSGGCKRRRPFRERWVSLKSSRSSRHRGSCIRCVRMSTAP